MPCNKAKLEKIKIKSNIMKKRGRWGASFDAALS
jgi:hypothetical protein